MKTKWILEELDCAVCAKEIENKINTLPNVKATINFTTLSLYIECMDAYSLEKIEEIINTMEPEVNIIKPKDNKDNVVLDIYNLDCATCALEIEQAISTLNNIEDCTVNFATSKINCTLKDNSLINTTINEIKKITKETEPEVEFNKPIKKDNVIKRYGIILSLVLFIIGLVSNNDISNICYIISYIIVGYNILIKAIKNIFKGKVFDENFLMSIATIGAFIIGEFAEGAAVMIFYAIGEIFQSYAVNKSRNSISSLMDINADHANLLVNDIIKVVDPKDVAIGDIIVLKSGERVPLDGICLSDNGTLDCSALSGESIPINIERNSNVLAGSINLSNTIKLEVTKDYINSSVARILELVENASNNKAPSVDFITRFAKIYTPIVVIAALLLALIPPLLNIGTLNEWIYRACVFLVVSCPCALVISIPLALFAGLGSASSKGILIKGGNYLEALANIDTIVFDKTGTLTKGTFSVNNVVSLDIDKDELLKIAAYGESMSTHPIAKSIVEYYNKPINNKLITNIEEISGKGIKCIMFDHTYFLGNASLMFSNGYNNLLDNDNTCVHIMQDNEYLGYISVSDELKNDSKLAIKELKSLGIKKCIMLSGDKASVVKRIANELCLDASYGQLLPGDKVAKLEEFMSNGRVAFVGDGINDAPVLARSDIGIAMGAMGSEAAIQAADVVLMNDTPTSIVTAIKISTKTKSILYQNIVLSLGIKLIVLVLAMLGIASMWLGVFADVGVTLLAILNSMRALKYKD